MYITRWMSKCFQVDDRSRDIQTRAKRWESPKTGYPAEKIDQGWIWKENDEVSSLPFLFLLSIFFSFAIELDHSRFPSVEERAAKLRNIKSTKI